MSFFPVVPVTVALAEGTEVISITIIDTKVRVVPMPIPIVTKAIPACVSYRVRSLTLLN